MFLDELLYPERELHTALKPTCGVPMATETIPLFCHQCGKHLDVREEDMNRVRNHAPESFLHAGRTLEYTGGCFYKLSARLKREMPSLLRCYESDD